MSLSCSGCSAHRRRLRAILWAVVACCLFVGTAVPAAAGERLTIGQAGDYALARSLHFVEDPQHTLTIEEIASYPPGRFHSGTPLHGELNFGYSASAFWLALPLSIQTDAPSLWLLEIASP